MAIRIRLHNRPKLYGRLALSLLALSNIEGPKGELPKRTVILLRRAGVDLDPSAEILGWHLH